MLSFLSETRSHFIDVAHLDFNLVEGLAVVDSNDASDHLRNHNHVTQVSLDTL